MTCRPISGRCERQRTDPFVWHLNDRESANFNHAQCLDRTITDRPQPEVLYVDGKTGATLVIERKNFLWPPDYAKVHAFEHKALDRIIEHLAEVCDVGAYELSFRTRGNLGRRNLEKFVDKLVRQIRLRINEMRPGDAITRSHVDGCWRFRRQAPEERDDWEPSTGLVIAFAGTGTHDLDDPSAIPDALANTISETLTSCEAKFREYSTARRIVLVEQFGDLLLCGEWWWRTVLQKLPPPICIDEIWKGYFGQISEEAEDWAFERLYESPQRVP